MNKNLNKVNTIKTILLILSICAFLFGAVTSYKAGKIRGIEREAKKIEVSVTDKTNADAYGNTLEFDFTFVIKNNSKWTANRIVGELKVSDADGNLLSSGEASFSDEMKPDSETTFTLSWRADNTAGSVEIWNSDFAQLNISFRITEIAFEGSYDLTEVDCEPFIKECDSAVLAEMEKSYQEALALYNQGKYAEAGVIFEKLGNYKDSYDYYLESGGKAETSAKDAIYNEAMSLLAAEKYGEAISKLYEIQYHSDSMEKIEEIIITAENKADALAAEGNYTRAAEILLGLGYDKDSSTMYRAYKYASDGDFSQAAEWGLTVAIIPEDVETIPDNYFKDSGSLTKVVLPSTIKTIGASAFKNCRALSEINLPNGLLMIGANAFESCMKLTSVKIPDSVLTISNSAFASCSGLADVKLSSAVQSIGESAFSGCSFTAITLPNSVISIGKSAFSGCSSLLSVTIPGSIKTISESAFSGCTKLSTVTISEGVEIVGNYAFSSCSTLAVVNMPTTLLEIGANAFYKCSSIAQITIPANLKKIGSNAFVMCGSLANVYFADTTTQWTAGSRTVSVADARQNASSLTSSSNTIWSKKLS